MLPSRVALPGSKPAKGSEPPDPADVPDIDVSTPDGCRQGLRDIAKGALAGTLSIEGCKVAVSALSSALSSHRGAPPAGEGRTAPEEAIRQLRRALAGVSPETLDDLE